MMSPYDQMADALQQLAGGPQQGIATASAPDGTTIEADLAAVDAQGALVREVRALAPQLAGVSFDVLKEWGDALSRRISYLLETLSLLETDEEQGQVLIRSRPPDRHGSATTYYEVLLSEQGAGQFVLRRYEAQKGVPGRQPVDMQLTHQVVSRLARDLVETVP